MSKVVDITGKIAEKNNLKEEQRYYDSHNEALDYLEEIFPYGAILIEICKNGSINLSTTVEDQEEIVEALVSAAFKVKEEMDKK